MAYTAQDTVKAIQQVAPNQDVALAMLTGAHLESGWNPNLAVVDSNGYTSAGPFMMNFSPGNWASPPISGNQANAENPYLAAQAIEPSYAAAVAGGSGHGYTGPTASLWQTNPELAAEQSATVAEGPAQNYYSSQGTSAVNSAYQASVQALGGKFTPGSQSGVGSQSTSYVGIGNPSVSVGNAVTGALPWPFNSIANLFGINSAITDIFPFFIGFVGLILVVWGISIVAKGSGVNISVPGGGGKPGVPAGKGAAGDAEAATEDAAVAA